MSYRKFAPILGALFLLASCSKGSSTDSAAGSHPGTPSVQIGQATDRGSLLVTAAQKRFQLNHAPVLAAAEIEEMFADGDLIRAIPSAPRFRGQQAIVRLPRTFDAALMVESMGVQATAKPRGLAKSPIEWAQHIAVYPDVDNGVHAFRRVTADGVEDLFQVDVPRSELSFAYDVSLKGVAGLRLIEGNLELLDESGTPRLRSPAPVVIDAKGESRVGAISVSGCAYDTNPVGPWGRKVTPPGANDCVVTARIDGRGLSYPVLVDPSWVTTITTKQTHANHIMLLIPGGADAGKVLILGGNGTGASVTELFNPGSSPTTGTWALSSSISTATFALGARAVALPNGQVVIAGGFPTSSTPAQATVYVRNQTTGVWTAGAAMSGGRAFHTMEVVKSGLKNLVLVAGGQLNAYLSSSPPKKTAELYDPDPAVDAWKTSSTMNMIGARTRQGSVKLADGRIFVAGGVVYSSFSDTSLATTEIFDPATSTWTAAPNMGTPRSSPVLASLGGSKVLVTGGFSESAYSSLNTMDYFDGTAFYALTAKMSQPRHQHTATRLDDGRILIAGGDATTDGSTAVPLVNVDLFLPGSDPKTGTIVSTASMSVARMRHAAVSLGSKGVLVTGGQTENSGFGDTGDGTETTSSELYDLTLGGACSSSSTCPSGLSCVDSVCCNKSSCPTGEKCNAPGHEGVCTKAKGAKCAGNGECASGFCVTGICCESSCSGGCKSCNDPTKLGVCVLATPGTDPGGFCAAGGDDCSSKCDSVGTCSLKTPMGTPCGASAAGGDGGTGTSFCNRYACSDWGSCDLTTYNCGLTCTTTVTCTESTKSCTPIITGIKAGFCVIDNTCYSYGDVNPKDPTKCQVCDPPTIKTAWTTSESCLDGGPDTGSVEDTGTVAEDTGVSDTTASDTGTARPDTGTTTDTGSSGSDASGDGSVDASDDAAAPIGDIGGGQACSCETPGGDRQHGQRSGLAAAGLLGLAVVIGSRRRRQG